MELTLDILKEFNKITGKDIESYFARCVVFFNSSYNRIVEYYNGTASSPEKGAFDEFESLKRECEEFFITYQSMNNRLNNLKWWMIIEKLEGVDSRLSSLAHINKWSKSSLGSVGYNPSIQVSYTLKPQQTLERVAQDILNKPNPQDDWNEIALSNQLIEEDYTPAGGVELNLNLPQINRGVQITSVVDTMIGKSIYGKDISRAIQFEGDDLVVLGYDDTVVQAVEILAALKKNDNPEYPADGLQREVVIGGTRAALNFPVISRQMTATFATDDSLKNFQVNTIEVNEDNLSIEFQVQTRLNETKEGQVVV